MQTKTYNQSGVEIGVTELPDSIFGLPENHDLVHQVRVAVLANKRKPVAHTKNRSEVRGGGRKPWRQKGTGRARHGSTRSPIWKGGGVAHGPRKEKGYSQKINKGMYAKALNTVLSSKFKKGEIRVVEDFSLSAPKTKDFKNIAQSIVRGEAKGVLMVTAPSNKNIIKAAKNISGVTVSRIGSLDFLDLLKAKKIVFTKSAIETLRNTKLYESTKKTVS